jgi:DMSO/TMAO reductase YedYZ molybdopterin-dependent catalytic subunit
LVADGKPPPPFGTPPGEDVGEGAPRERMIARKTERAQAAKAQGGTTEQTGRHTDAGADARRLPPGQTRTHKWPVLDLGPQPVIVPENWKLTVGGAVRNRIAWDWANFMGQPQAELTSDIHCVTAWSRFDNTWRGVSTQHILSMVQPEPFARFVIVHGYDGYTTNLPLARFAAANALIAHSWQGQPLTREHGGPARLVVPDLYFWKSAKWVRHLTFLDSDTPGYWEARGYHDEGDPWRNQRFG